MLGGGRVEVPAAVRRWCSACLLVFRCRLARRSLDEVAGRVLRDECSFSFSNPGAAADYLGFGRQGDRRASPP